MLKKKTELILAFILLIGISVKVNSLKTTTNLSASDNYKIITAPSSFTASVPKEIRYYYVIVKADFQNFGYIVLNTEWDTLYEVTVSGAIISEEVDVQKLDSYTYQGNIYQYSPIQVSAKATSETKYIVYRINKGTVFSIDFTFTASTQTNFNIVKPDTSFQVSVQKAVRYYYVAVETNFTDYGYILLTSDWDTFYETTIEYAALTEDIDVLKFDSYSYANSTSGYQPIEKPVKATSETKYIVFRIAKGTNFDFAFTFNVTSFINYKILEPSSTYKFDVPKSIKYFFAIIKTDYEYYGDIDFSCSWSTAIEYTIFHKVLSEEINLLQLESYKYTTTSTDYSPISKTIRATNQHKYVIFVIAKGTIFDANILLSISSYENLIIVDTNSTYTFFIPKGKHYHYIAVKNIQENNFGFITLLGEGFNQVNVTYCKITDLFNSSDIEERTYIASGLFPSTEHKSKYDKYFEYSVNANYENSHIVFRINKTTTSASATIKFTTSYMTNYHVMNSFSSYQATVPNSLNTFYIVVEKNNTYISGYIVLDGKKTQATETTVYYASINTKLNNQDIYYLTYYAGDTGYSGLFRYSSTFKKFAPATSSDITYVIFYVKDEEIKNYNFTTSFVPNYKVMQVDSTFEMTIPTSFQYYYILIENKTDEENGYLTLFVEEKKNSTFQIAYAQSSLQLNNIKFENIYFMTYNPKVKDANKKISIQANTKTTYVIIRIKPTGGTRDFKFTTSYYKNYIIMNANEKENIQLISSVQYLYIISKNYIDFIYNGISELKFYPNNEFTAQINGSGIVTQNWANLDYQGLSFGTLKPLDNLGQISVQVNKTYPYSIFKISKGYLDGNVTIESNLYPNFLDMQIPENKDFVIKAQMDYYYIILNKAFDGKTFLSLNSSSLANKLDIVKTSISKYEINTNKIEGWEACSSNYKIFFDFKNEDYYAIIRLQTGTNEGVLNVKVANANDYIQTNANKYEFVQSFDFYQYVYIFVENPKGNDGFFSLDLIPLDYAINDVQYAQIDSSPKEGNYDYNSLTYTDAGEIVKYDSINELIVPTTTKKLYTVFRINTNSKEGKIDAITRFGKNKIITQDISLDKSRSINPVTAEYYIIVDNNKKEGSLVFSVNYDSEYKNFNFAFTDKEKYEINYNSINWESQKTASRCLNNKCISSIKLKAVESAKYLIYQLNNTYQEKTNGMLTYNTKFLATNFIKDISIGKQYEFNLEAENFYFNFSLPNNEEGYVNIEIGTDEFTIDKLIFFNQSNQQSIVDLVNISETRRLFTLYYYIPFSKRTISFSLPESIIDYEKKIIVNTSNTIQEPSIFNYAYVTYFQKIDKNTGLTIPMNKYGLYVFCIKEETTGVKITADNFINIPDVGLTRHILKEPKESDYINKQIKNIDFAKCSNDGDKRKVSFSFEYEKKGEDEKEYNFLVFSIVEEKHKKNTEVYFSVEYIQESNTKVYVVVGIGVFVIIALIIGLSLILKKKRVANLDYNKVDNLLEKDNIDLNCIN